MDTIDQGLELHEESFLDKGLIYIATILYILVISTVMIQVIDRWSGIIDITGTAAISRVFFIIGTFFGAAVASRNRENIGFYLVTDYISEEYPSISFYLDKLVRIIVITCLTIVLYALILSSMSTWGATFEGLRPLTFGMVYVGMAIGITIYIWYEVQKLLEE